jgi:hypothetical protein
MAIIKLKIQVDELENVLSQFNRIKVYRSTDGIDGTYSEITNTSTRIPLQQGVTQYIYDDQSGEITYYYKTSYFHTTTTLESALSEPRRGSDPVTDGILSMQELLDVYLFGVDLTDDQGNPYPEIIFEWSIRYAIDWLEKELDIKIRPTRLTERYDYYRRDYQEWVYMRMRNAPIIDDVRGNATIEAGQLDPDATRVKVIWPSGTVVLEFKQSWVNIREDAGQINIIPAAGTLSQVLLTAGGSFLPLLAEGRDFVPDLFEISYTAGFREGEVPWQLRELIGKKAAMGPLNIAGDLLVGAGIAGTTLGIDGYHNRYRQHLALRTQDTAPGFCSIVAKSLMN